MHSGRVSPFLNCSGSGKKIDKRRRRGYRREMEPMAAAGKGLSSHTLVASLFRQLDWAMVELEPGVWRGPFCIESEEEFDLYAMATDDRLFLAVTPVIDGKQVAEPLRLYRALLALNQQLPSIRFALDGEGDVTLLADLSIERLAAAELERVIDLLVAATSRFVEPLRRTAADPTYFSSLLA